MPRLKQRTDTLRERGLASALAVLAEEGVAGLTTRTVARRAEASVPAIYEVFGDKAGLIRELFFHGFRVLGDDLDAAATTAGAREAATTATPSRAANPETHIAAATSPDARDAATTLAPSTAAGDETHDAAADPLAALRRTAQAFRGFVVGNPVLAQVMFSRPFADFDPTPEDHKAGIKVRKIFVQRVRDAVDAGQLDGDPTDIAHVLFEFVQGMAAAESAQRLGASPQSVDRRWRLGLDALLKGLS
ncbi:TetR/AcrR family transcriptional regulator [Actinoplanes sp. TBRC 11911]|uniref:TetR/AcrR family transcriptional regulator n=1 Tax=Actinoplanes sp. TBRC 11911 TaxID=2729386 RepID=UPI00145F6DF5|nr:TetR/AcrR family transcriptional regulator [Actinoplanes sp. TBRC 11911]NMO49823.1 TetR/AcrR family transcriptional regulator [Actinoplanes sp. TBRC 11911]